MAQGDVGQTLNLPSLSRYKEGDDPICSVKVSVKTLLDALNPVVRYR